jgi:hypothetical protein
MADTALLGPPPSGSDSCKEAGTPGGTPVRGRYGSDFYGEIGHKGGAPFVQRASRANRIRHEIGQLETVRESVASDEAAAITLTVSTGAGKTELYCLAALQVLETAQVRQLQLLRTGSRVATTDWPSSQTATFSDGTLLGFVALVAAARVPDLSQAPVSLLPPYRPADQWRPLAAFEAGKGWIHRSGAHQPRPSPERYQSDFITLVIGLDQFRQLRAGLLRIIDGVLAALRLALVLVLAAYAYCPATRSLTLLIIATFRHYGHRSEPDDYALPTYRWMSVIGGESAFSC